MSRRTLGRATGSLAVLTLLLAACGSGGSTGEEPAGGETYEPGPLGEFFERAYGDWDEDESVREAQRVEEIVAECMAEEGFEYIPVDQTQFTSYDSDDLDIDWGSREFAEQYGYGITTDPWSDGEAEDPMPIEDEFVDPNSEYVESMSETEMEAYYVALYGDQELVEGEEEVEWDWTQNGCTGRAQHEVYEGGDELEGFEALEEEMNALWERSQTDPRITEANDEWVACMADAGFTGLATADDTHMQISEKSNAIWEEAYAEQGEDMEMTEEDYLAIEKEVEERLAEITDEEIAMAVADWDCRKEVRFEDVLTEVNNEYEQEFVDAHRDELEAWVEAVSAGRS